MVEMNVTSTEFGQGENIPKKYTCQGEDVNPPLKVEGIPEETEKLALVIDDPDAPGGTFDHWLVCNIPVESETEEIEEDSVPEEAVEGENDFGKEEYRGPCPPSGTHRYRFRVYALEEEVDLEPGYGKENLKEKIDGYVVGKAEMTAEYGKE